MELVLIRGTGVIVDTCDECGHRVELELPRQIRQEVLCEPCWREQEYYPEGDVF